MSLSIDMKELEALQKRLDKASKEQCREFFDGCARKLAAGYLGVVIPNTPVGEYPKESGKKGGTLRRGWTADKDVDPEDEEAVEAFAKTLPVTHSAKSHTITVENKAQTADKVNYASYVEDGHRQTPGRYVPAIGKRLVASYVPPQYFAKKSEEAFEPKIPGVVEKYADKFMKGIINGE